MPTKSFELCAQQNMILKLFFLFHFILHEICLWREIVFDAHVMCVGVGCSYCVQLFVCSKIIRTSASSSSKKKRKKERCSIQFVLFFFALCVVYSSHFMCSVHKKRKAVHDSGYIFYRNCCILLCYCYYVFYLFYNYCLFFV